MTTDPVHYGAELQDLLDGRLAEPRRSEVSAHVETCARCRREIEALRWVKSEVPKHFDDVEPPPALVSRVRAALDAADSSHTALGAPRTAVGSGSQPRLSRRAWILGALAAAAALLVFLRGYRSPTLPALVAADFVAYRRGTERLGIESADPKAVDAYFARNGISFATSVYDLGMMQYQLEGGRVHRLGRRTSALFAYRGPGNTALVCQMYEGRVADLPVTGDVRSHNGVTFFVHRVDNLTLVFWEEGDVVCVLASDAAPEDVVQLAFAKAARVGPAAS